MTRSDLRRTSICLLAGLVGGLIASAVLSRSLIWAGLAGISAGEWLQAIAAIVGVFLTVWATLWLEEQRRTRERLEEQRLITEALHMLQAALPAASQPLADGLGHAQRVGETREQFEAVQVNLETLSYARQSYRVRSYNLWNALAEIDAAHTLARQRIGNEQRLVRDDRVTGPVLAIARERLEDFAGNLIQPVRAAVEALESERG